MSGKQVRQAIDQATIDRQDHKPRQYTCKTAREWQDINNKLTAASFDIQTGLECK